MSHRARGRAPGPSSSTSTNNGVAGDRRYPPSRRLQGRGQSVPARAAGAAEARSADGPRDGQPPAPIRRAEGRSEQLPPAACRTTAERRLGADPARRRNRSSRSRSMRPSSNRSCRLRRFEPVPPSAPERRPESCRRSLRARLRGWRNPGRQASTSSVERPRRKGSNAGQGLGRPRGLERQGSGRSRRTSARPTGFSGRRSASVRPRPPWLRRRRRRPQPAPNAPIRSARRRAAPAPAGRTSPFADRPGVPPCAH